MSDTTSRCLACRADVTRPVKAHRWTQFCEPCKALRAEWLRMRAPSQPEVFRRCKGCHGRLTRFEALNRRFCDDCSRQKQLRRWAEKDRPERERVRQARRVEAVCEGCAATFPLHTSPKLRFCPACAGTHQVWLKRGKPLAACVRDAMRRESAANQEAERARLRLPQYDDHVKRHKRWVARIEAAKDKPWLHPSLSQGDKWRLRYRHDPDFHASERVRNSLRRRRRGKERNIAYFMRRAVKSGTEGDRWISRWLGYTATDLRLHIEKQFGRGMTWERFAAGEIDIDHIIPVSSFDLTEESEVKAAWALSNLRPMWSKDNRAKWATRTHLL